MIQLNLMENQLIWKKNQKKEKMNKNNLKNKILILNNNLNSNKF